MGWDGSKSKTPAAFYAQAGRRYYSYRSVLVIADWPRGAGREGCGARGLGFDRACPTTRGRRAPARLRTTLRRCPCGAAPLGVTLVSSNGGGAQSEVLTTYHDDATQSRPSAGSTLSLARCRTPFEAVFDLSSQLLQDAALPAISPILASAEAHFITSLQLARNEIGCGVGNVGPVRVHFIQRSCRVVLIFQIKRTHAPCRSAGWSLLSQALSQNRTITELDLSYNQIGAGAHLAAAACLSTRSRLLLASWCRVVSILRCKHAAFMRVGFIVQQRCQSPGRASQPPGCLSPFEYPSTRQYCSHRPILRGQNLRSE